jgi:serine/threonine-protein kinase
MVGIRNRIEHVIADDGVVRMIAARDEAVHRAAVVATSSSAAPGPPQVLVRWTEAAADHDGLVVPYESGVHRNAPFLLLAPPERTLADDLGPDGLEPARAQAVGLGILAGLAALHRVGIIHGGLTPEAVVLDGDVVRIAPGPMALPPAGAPPPTSFWAPELAARAAATPLSDVWAAGALVVAASSGMTALERWPEVVPADVPASMAGFLERATAGDPLARYASATEMLAALRVAEVSVGMRRRARSDWPRNRRARVFPSSVVAAGLLAGAYATFGAAGTGPATGREWLAPLAAAPSKESARSGRGAAPTPVTTTPTTNAPEPIVPQPVVARVTSSPVPSSSPTAPTTVAPLPVPPSTATPPSSKPVRAVGVPDPHDGRAPSAGDDDGGYGGGSSGGDDGGSGGGGSGGGD